MPSAAASRRSDAVSAAAGETSSERWRSERPPIVLLGAIRQWTRILLTFTRPYFGTASSMSKTLAVSTYSGGSSSSVWIEQPTRLQIALELRPARCGSGWPSRARPSADSVTARGAVEVFVDVVVSVAVAMGGESTHRRRGDQGKMAQFISTSTELEHVEVGRCPLLCRGFYGPKFPAICSDVRDSSTAGLRSGPHSRGSSADGPEPPGDPARGGSRKLSVPDRDQRRAHVEQLARVRRALTPPIPITGISTRAATAATWASATARIAGPRETAGAPPSHGRAPAVAAGASAIARSVLISDTASAPPSCAATRTARDIGGVRRQLDDQRLAVRARTARTTRLQLARVGADVEARLHVRAGDVQLDRRDLGALRRRPRRARRSPRASSPSRW